MCDLAKKTHKMRKSCQDASGLCERDVRSVVGGGRFSPASLDLLHSKLETILVPPFAQTARPRSTIQDVHTRSPNILLQEYF